MIEWFASNIGTICVLLVLGAVVAFAVRNVIKSRKSGCASCGGSCGACNGSCGGNCSCH